MFTRKEKDRDIMKMPSPSAFERALVKAYIGERTTHYSDVRNIVKAFMQAFLSDADVRGKVEASLDIGGLTTRESNAEAALNALQRMMESKDA